MKLRIPIAVAITPVGLLVGALIVGRPVSVDGDLVLDPSVSSTPVQPVGPPASDPTTDTTDSTITPPATSTTTTSGPPQDTGLGQVDAASRVIVANATSTSGVAGRNAATLTSVGYVDVRTADTQPSATSTVYARPGFESVGQAIADTLGVEAPLASFPVEPITPLDDDADVLVVIGADLVSAP